MIFREATLDDIKQMHSVRMSVKENALSNPFIVQEKDYTAFLTTRGKGWLCQVNNEIVGFAIVDHHECNVWALFVKPEFERKGIGKKLHDMMLDLYFEKQPGILWLSTAPNTRAEAFYKKAGWQHIGLMTNGEVRFEMTREKWVS